MQAGRKPKPVKLKLIEGNPGKRPLNLDELKPNPIAPKCPSWLMNDAKKEWKRVAPELEILGLLTHIDMASFAGYCQSFAKWKKAEEFIKKHGSTYKIPKRDKDGNVVSVYIAQFPEVAIANQCLNQVRAFCAEFGLTPSSRGRISLPGENFDDELESLCD